MQQYMKICHGLRQTILNVQYQVIRIQSVFNYKKNISISVNDDGPGFPEDIKDILGEPYIKSKSKEVSLNSGLGLGTFLGKTLLEKQGAKLAFSKNNELGGASVIISWDIKNLKPIF